LKTFFLTSQRDEAKSNFGQNGTSNCRQKPEIDPSFQPVSYLWFIVLCVSVPPLQPHNHNIPVLKSPGDISWKGLNPGDVAWIKLRKVCTISLCQGPKPTVLAGRKKTFRCFVVGLINCHSESENFLKSLLTHATSPV
jgi:hypothetical protein